jgi:quinol monooxygenase YgiN
MAFISVTRLRLRAFRFLPQFLWYTLLSARQARRSQGQLDVQTLRDANLTFWTLSAWEDEAAMRAFMMSGAHRRAMPKLLDWCDEASIVHWTQETATLPGWLEAHRRMVAEGRMSKVRHPSPEQQAKRIAPPKSK